MNRPQATQAAAAPFGGSRNQSLIIKDEQTTR